MWILLLFVGSSPDNQKLWSSMKEWKCYAILISKNRGRSFPFHKVNLLGLDFPWWRKYIFPKVPRSWLALAKGKASLFLQLIFEWEIWLINWLMFLLSARFIFIFFHYYWIIVQKSTLIRGNDAEDPSLYTLNSTPKQYWTIRQNNSY